MKDYKYVRADDIEKYKGWELVEVLPRYNESYYNMVILCKEDKPIQNYIKLNEATIDELLQEIRKRTKE